MNRQLHNTRKLWTFFILTFVMMLLTWGVMAVFRIAGASANPSATPPPAGVLVLFLLGGFSPSIAGMICTWRFEGKAGLHNLWRRATQFNLGWKWYLIILLIPLSTLALRIAVHLMRGGILKESPLFAQPLALIGFTVQIFLFGPISEEFGWRGFALEPLLAKWNVLKSSLILGALWALWHLPLFFIPGTIQQLIGNVPVEFIIFALGVIGATVVYTWLYLNTGRSLWSAILYHATANYTFSFLATLMEGGVMDRLLVTFVQLALGTIIAVTWSRKSKNKPTLA